MHQLTPTGMRSPSLPLPPTSSLGNTNPSPPSPEPEIRCANVSKASDDGGEEEEDDAEIATPEERMSWRAFHTDERSQEREQVLRERLAVLQRCVKDPCVVWWLRCPSPSQQREIRGVLPAFAERVTPVTKRLVFWWLSCQDWLARGQCIL